MRCFKVTYNKFQGFTFIEILITLSLLGLLFCFILGFNQTFFAKNKIDILEQQVINSIHYARNQALISGRAVTLNAADYVGGWSSGIILFFDNQSHHYSEQDKLLYSWHWQHSSQIKLLWRGFESDDYLTFSANLRRSTANGHFVILKDGVEVRRMVVNRLGRVKKIE